MSKKQADIAARDCDFLENFIEWLRAYEWQVNSCGNDGKLEMDKVRCYAPQVIKILVNYI